MDVKLFSCDPVVLPPGGRPTCACLHFAGTKQRVLPVLHPETQDTSCDAWHRALENIESAKAAGIIVFDPLAGMTGDQRAQIITLPPSIGQLDQVQELKLYSSHLVRLPAEIEGMTSLRYLDVYTSYRLHYAPYEVTRCKALRESRWSTRALYGNVRHRPDFPHLLLPENEEILAQSTPTTCSVCSGSLENVAPIRRWISLVVGTDTLPLLVHACSKNCISALPPTPPNYVRGAHTGGHHIRQPPARR